MEPMPDVAEYSPPPNSGTAAASVPTAVTPTASSSDESPVDPTAQLAARDQFLAIVGHELRNSLAPLMLLAEQFAAYADARTPLPPDVLAARAAMLGRQLRKLVGTVDRVSEIADLRRGRLALAPGEVDVVALVEEVIEEARRDAVAQRRTAELAVRANGPVAGQWDRARLKQIVGNLVGNGIVHGGGCVEVDVRDLGDRIEIDVRDHGPGIDAAVMPRLFDRLDDASAPRTRGGGLGTGLWVVKQLCTAMQANVTAMNLANGAIPGGARFCLTLPRG